MLWLMIKLLGKIINRDSKKVSLWIMMKNKINKNIKNRKYSFLLKFLFWKYISTQNNVQYINKNLSFLSCIITHTGERFIIVYKHITKINYSKSPHMRNKEFIAKNKTSTWIHLLNLNLWLSNIMRMHFWMPICI